MRKLKLAIVQKTFFIENVPDEYKFIESLSRQYAKSQLDLEAYYKAGLNAYLRLNENASDEFLKKNEFWAVRQAIIVEAQKIPGNTSDSK